MVVCRSDGVSSIFSICDKHLNADANGFQDTAKVIDSQLDQHSGMQPRRCWKGTQLKLCGQEKTKSTVGKSRLEGWLFIFPDDFSCFSVYCGISLLLFASVLHSVFTRHLYRLFYILICVA